jgi:hypothetical protein
VTIRSGVRVRFRSRTIASVLAMVLVASSIPAFAQSASDKATAVSLFDEGKKLVKDGKYAEACPKFELSQKLDPGVGTLGSLADCYEKAGKVASAWTTWRETAAAAAAKGQADREKFARDKAKALESKVPHFTIVVPNEARAPGLSVHMAGTKADLLWDIAIPTDPGTFTLEATAPNKKTYTTSVTLAVGGPTVTVTIPMLEPGAGPTTIATTPTDGTTTSPPTDGTTAPTDGSSTTTVASDLGSSSGSSQKTIAYVVGGVGLAGIVVGSIFGLKAKSKNSDADANCRPDDSTRCNSLGVQASDDAHSAATISTIAFAAGGAALVAGVVLFFTAPKDKETSSAPSVGLGFGVAHGGIGISAQGAF